MFANQRVKKNAPPPSTANPRSQMRLRKVTPISPYPDDVLQNELNAYPATRPRQVEGDTGVTRPRRFFNRGGY